MKIIKLAGVSFLLGMAAPATAQSITDDVQCLVLSEAFATSAIQEAPKLEAASALFFYLGRLNANADQQAVKNTIQTLKIDPKTAPTGMTACAARFDDAVQGIQARGKPSAPRK
jgi:hypothetical protein